VGFDVLKRGVWCKNVWGLVKMSPTGNEGSRVFKGF